MDLHTWRGKTAGTACSSSVWLSTVRVVLRILTIKQKFQAREASRVLRQVNKLKPDEWRWGPSREMQQMEREARPTGPSQAAMVKKTDACQLSSRWKASQIKIRKGKEDRGLAPVLKCSVGSERLLRYQVLVHWLLHLMPCGVLTESIWHHFYNSILCTHSQLYQ